MLTCLPVLGLSSFRAAAPPSESDAPDESRFFLRARGVQAEARIDAEGFVVLKGSQAHKTPAPAFLRRPEFRGEVTRRQSLIDEGVLVDNGDTYVLGQDYSFTSPTAATCSLLGSSGDPYRQWRTADGRTLHEIVRGRDDE
ncbi:MAG: DUF4357 domain-containing protein [Chloroflexi bacterium]|nr:DUF4357 domain-containing protein [Chloroflexota bacterium]